MWQTITTFQEIEAIIKDGTCNVFWQNTDYRVVKDNGFFFIEETAKGTCVDIVDNTYHFIEDFFVLPKQ